MRGDRSDPGRLNGCVLRPTLLVAAASLVAFASAAQTTPARTADRADLWVKHTILLYAYPSQPDNDFWTVEKLKWLAAYRDAQGRTKDFFFDGFLILGFGCKGGRHLLGLDTRKPATKADWSGAVSAYLNTALRLSRAFEETRRELGEPEREAKVVLAMPFPDTRDARFGPVGGRQLDLERLEDRTAAVAWYVDETLRQWHAREADGGLAGARLVGFYWGREGIWRGDEDLLRNVSGHIHRKGLLFHWIPAYGGGRKDWRELGFDCTTQQINYQNPQEPGRPLTIFDDMTRLVRDRGLHGVEMTPMARTTHLNPRVWSWHQVFLANLEAALRLDWRRHEALTYFYGNSLCAVGADPATHVFYEKLYRWTKGLLTDSDVEHLCGVVVNELASRGHLSEERGQEIAAANAILDKLALMEKSLVPKRAPTPEKTFGEQWESFTADDPYPCDVDRHRPGVCLLPGREWGRPRNHGGRTAVHGGFYPGAGGPNFLVNDPPPRDIEVRLNYWTEAGGALRVYDGVKYHRVADLTTKGAWDTVTGRIRAEIVAAPKADAAHPGLNIMFEVRSDDVYVHRIEVRAVEE